MLFPQLARRDERRHRFRHDCQNIGFELRPGGRVRVRDREQTGVAFRQLATFGYPKMPDQIIQHAAAGRRQRYHSGIVHNDFERDWGNFSPHYLKISLDMVTPSYKIGWSKQRRFS